MHSSRMALTTRRWNWIRLSKDDGVTAIEYAVLVGVFAVALIAGVNFLYNGLGSAYNSTAAKVSASESIPPPSTPPPSTPPPSTPPPSTPTEPPAIPSLNQPVPKGGSFTSNVFLDAGLNLNPAGTVTEWQVEPGSDSPITFAMTPTGQYTWIAPNGKGKTITISFAYTQDGLTFRANNTLKLVTTN